MTKVNYKTAILTSLQISWDNTMRNFLSMHLLGTNKNIFYSETLEWKLQVQLCFMYKVH